MKKQARELFDNVLELEEGVSQSTLLSGVPRVCV